MCGICGYVNLDHSNPAQSKIAVEMQRSLEHRGPDDKGIYTWRNVSLGFQRLSIIDLAGGHQPMANEDESIWIVFNGEIYNHEEIREELLASGHSFRTRSDTECIVHAYEQYGDDCFNRFNGMFAIAISDQRKARVLIARDRLGIKPLYYHQSPMSVAFASEIKALLKHPEVLAEVDGELVEEFFRYRFIASPATLFKGIVQLEPGHLLILEAGAVKKECFWSVPTEGHPKQSGIEGTLDTLDEALHESVKMRMMADVPLGTFCSGGVDSSLITAYASEYAAERLHTFSVGFGEHEFDESEFALAVAQKFKTNHHRLVLDNETFADTLPKAIWHNDEPLNHANSVPIYLISKLASEYVKVVLTGEGADELFGGYPRYVIVKLLRFLRPIPRLLLKPAGAIAGQLSFGRFKKLVGFHGMTTAAALAANAQFVTQDSLENVLNEPVSGSYSRREQLVQHLGKERDDLGTLMVLDIYTYLQNLLQRMDKMTMAASIEARVPFLDHTLVSWAMSVPTELKIRNLSTKYIVKALAERYLPTDVIHRRKSGFGVPLDAWLREERGLGRYLEMFSDSRFRERPYFNTQGVHKLVAEHRSNRAHHGEILWELINFELWQREFGL